MIEVWLHVCACKLMYCYLAWDIEVNVSLYAYHHSAIQTCCDAHEGPGRAKSRPRCLSSEEQRRIGMMGWSGVLQVE